MLLQKNLLRLRHKKSIFYNLIWVNRKEHVQREIELCAQIQLYIFTCVCTSLSERIGKKQLRGLQGSLHSSYFVFLLHLAKVERKKAFLGFSRQLCHSMNPKTRERIARKFPHTFVLPAHCLKGNLCYLHRCLSEDLL